MIFQESLWLWTLVPVALLVLFGRRVNQEAERASEATFGRRWRELRTKATMSCGRVVALLGAGTACVVVALARPSWGYEASQGESRRGDLWLLLDLSRSMLVSDVGTDRLSLARRHLERLFDAAQGERIGVMAYAGDAVVACPLTRDYGALSNIVASLDPREVSLGGSNLASGLSRILDRRGAESERRQAVWVISDGEDHGDEEVLDTLGESLAERDVALFALGVGTREGGKVPGDVGSGKAFAVDEHGRVVHSSADFSQMRALASKTGGDFWDGVDTHDASRQCLERAFAATDKDETSGASPIERYQWPLGLVAIGLAVTLWRGRR